MTDQALRPDFFVSNMPSLKKTAKVEDEPTDDEKHLYALSKHAGWRILEKRIQNAVADMDNINKTAMEAGANYETLGQNTVVITFVKDLIKRAITDPINDAIEVFEQPDERQ